LEEPVAQNIHASLRKASDTNTRPSEAIVDQSFVADWLLLPQPARLFFWV